MGLVGYDWAPFGVDLATTDHEAAAALRHRYGRLRLAAGRDGRRRALATGAEPRIAVEHALHVLEVIEAARESGRTGRRIALTSSFTWPMV